MSSGARLKRSSSTSADKMKQQQLSSMLGDRVKKPRSFSADVPPVLKKRKLESDNDVTKVPSSQLSAPAGPAPIAVQKKKWRLSEIVKRDKEAKKMREQFTPAFVYKAPHMDSRRPGLGGGEDGDSVNGIQKKKGGEVEKIKAANVESEKKSSSETATPPVHGRCVYNTTAELPGTRSHGTTSVPGSEALLYSRSMLPKSHLLLLDVLVALESAIALLRSRRVFPTISAVQEIVRRSTRREFTMKILSQLAHVVPEAIAVLPPVGGAGETKSGPGAMRLRLDDVNLKETQIPGDQSSKSILGDAAVRSRRSLLHKRLLEHVRESHSRFLDRKSIKRYESELWHPEFDLEVEVPELPSPPLYNPKTADAPSVGSSVAKRPKSSTSNPPDNDSVPADVLQKVRERVKAQELGVVKESNNTDQDGIPLELLRKVRERVKARETQVAEAQVEKDSNRSLVSKLPCTMDTICSVLRGERRGAMGWAQLISKVEKLHPKKWPRQDLETQFDAIADLAGDWCKKIELKSSRGGFAFRVVSEASFGKARAKVSSTETYGGKKSDGE